MKTIQHILVLIFYLFAVQTNAQIFQDKPSNEDDGDFPKKWDLVKGSAEITTFEGEKIINLGNNAIIKPLIDSSNYLSDTFTLEFDAYFDAVEKSINYQYYSIRFWEGYGVGKEPSSTGSVTTFPLKIFRHGAEFEFTIRDPKARKETFKNYKVTLEGKEALWRQVVIDYKKGALKVFIDGTQILNLPRTKSTPKLISIEGFAKEYSKEFTRAIKNVKIGGLKSSHTEGEIMATTPFKPEATNTNTSTNTSNTSGSSTQPTGQVSSTINPPIGVGADTSINTDSIQQNKNLNPVEIPEGQIITMTTQDPLEPIDATTETQITRMELPEKPIKLKVTLTDLLSIKRYDSSGDGVYNFSQAIIYTAKNNNIIAIEKISGGKMSNETTSVEFGTNTLGRVSFFRTGKVSGKRESNVMNSLVFNITQQELKDKSAKFLIYSFLDDRTPSNIWGNEKGILYDSYIEVDIYNILADLILAKKGENLVGFTEPFHDPEITRAKIKLYKTYDSGPNAKLWVRNIGKTLEGPISLGTTKVKDGHRGAAWIKFELLDY